MSGQGIFVRSKGNSIKDYRFEKTKNRLQNMISAYAAKGFFYFFFVYFLNLLTWSGIFLVMA